MSGTIPALSSPSIAATMITMDRSPRGKSNYLPETLANLKRGGMFMSPHLQSFTLFDSGSPEGWLRRQVADADIFAYLNIPVASHPRLACENAGTALTSGGLHNADFVLFLEDDIDVCADFLGSVARWLRDHAMTPRADCYRLFAFGASYPGQINVNFARGATAWIYPVDAFYGTQCFAVRSTDAVSLGGYITLNPEIGGVRNPNAYDLMFHTWAKFAHPGCSFLASVPSFVEHIGRDSVCTGKDETHRFPWQGRQWRYLSSDDGSVRIAA